MAAVYKSLSKGTSNGSTRDADAEKPRNRQRVLMLSSRGVTMRHRHLLNDLHSLLPHSRKDAKLDTKTQLSQLNELADLYNCNNVMFFEARKGKDLYLWLSKPPNGPTVKMHCQNVHTTEELNFTGNCLKGLPPGPQLRRQLRQAAAHPRKVKPFTDHVMGFTLAGNGKIWIRCYQISEQEAAKTVKPGETADPKALPSISGNKGETNISLVEIGPRLVLTPIVIQEGSFGGPIIYENKEFVSPNQIRSDLRRAKAGRYNERTESTTERKARHRDLGLRTGEGVKNVDPLDNRVVFA
ncbi:hypothetical protein Q7P36_000238 [Cladosporium allicinum]